MKSDLSTGHRYPICALLVFITLLLVTGCRGKHSPEENKALLQPAAVVQNETPQHTHEAESVVVSGLGVKVELDDHHFDGNSFRIEGVPNGYQIWASITDGSYESYLVFNEEWLHVAEITVRYELNKQIQQIAPLERYKLHFEKLAEFPVWETQATIDQPPAPGLRTQFTDGRFGYQVTTRGEERWLLDNWTFKSTENLTCNGPEMCPIYTCVCGYTVSGRPQIAEGDRLVCVEQHCVASEACDDFCLSIDFAERDRK